MIEIKLLISPEFFKSVAPIHDSLDDKYLRSEIHDCQLMYILPIIHDDLFNKIISDGAGITGNYKKLFSEYVIPALVNAVKYHLSIGMSSQIENVGRVQTAKTGSTHPSLSDIYKTINQDSTKMNFFLERLKGYLKANKDLFEEYKNHYTCESESTNFQSSIYLGD